MKTQRNIFRLVLALVLGVLSILGTKSFAADPSFSIIPAQLTGKLHCNYRFYMRINPAGIAYNTFQSTIKFDSGNVQLTHISINPVFNYLTDAFMTGTNLYRARGAMLPGQSSTATITGLTFGFKTTQNITGTELLITDKNGDPVVFDSESMSDGAVLQSYVTTKDILTGVNSGSYTFEPLPCIVDGTAPSVPSSSPTDGARYIAPNYTISFVIYDRFGIGSYAGDRPMDTNSTQHYRYSGLNTILTNYQPSPDSVDNQEGVNSGTISITVACPTCSGGAGRSYTMPAIPSLTVTERTGDTNHNQYTRDSQIRGYVISFPAPAPYEIEKEVTVYRTGADNPNENGTVHTGHNSFSFNSPQNPQITMTAPVPASLNPTTFSSFQFSFSDDRAGIDTGSVSITIPQYNSGTKFYTGHTYSGSELTFVLNGGSEGTGNSGSYIVSFTALRPFPSNAIIQVTGTANDLVGNTGSLNTSFRTMMSCADLGCADYFTVNIFTGFNTGSYIFTGTLIQITGTQINSPYPYLTGTYNEILMCGLPYSGTVLTGNIGIYDTTGTQINGFLYTSDLLYITGLDGLDFTYSNGVIVVQ